MPFAYLRGEGQAQRMGTRLTAIVAQGDRGRVYLPGLPQQEAAAGSVAPGWLPDASICHWPGRTNVVEYGLTTFGDLFTSRQLVALTTFSDLVGEAMGRIRLDAVAASLPDDDRPLRDGGTGATAYAQAVGLYLACALSRLSDICNGLCRWEVTKTQVRNLFGRQAIPMIWDFAENNVFGGFAGDYMVSLENMVKALEKLPSCGRGSAKQGSAQAGSLFAGPERTISTDPPYYDNIGYADLSDFFYVWLRRSLRPLYPDLFATMAVPKAEELVASAYRHGGKQQAEQFFLDGMTQAMKRLGKQAHPGFPVTIYYAFKQSETKRDTGTVRTGWETFLDAVMRSGFAVTGTWPVRTELLNKIGMGANLLASSIVLVCRPRSADAPLATRREFLAALRAELPQALRLLQTGNVAPVDLAQAAIGPGMAVYTRYARVLEPSGQTMSVREALVSINRILDEVLTAKEGDLDPDSRWAIAWFEESGFNEGDYGSAETLATAKVTSVEGLVKAGILRSRSGKVQLRRAGDLAKTWDPTTDSRLSVWEALHHLIRVLESDGEQAAGDLHRRLGGVAGDARELCYRLFALCEHKKWPAEALSYNRLVQSWPEIDRISREASPEQRTIKT